MRQGSPWQAPAASVVRLLRNVGAKVGLFGLSALLVVGCFNPAQERARRDRSVGSATSAGIRVEVAHGYAAIRALDEHRIHLWESAPTLEMELLVLGDESEETPLVSASLPEPRPVELFVENCMPNAELTVVTGEASLAVLPKELPTECRFQLVLRTARVALRLADPLAETEGVFHFGVLSDIQEAIDRVQDVYHRINQEHHLSFVLGAGDLTEDGTVPELERFQQELKTLRLPYYTTLGNHELGVSPPPYHDYFGRGNFSFVFRGVRFTLLDSASATIDPQVYDWLDDWLDQGMDQVHIVAMHIPPIDPVGVRNGSFASRNEATKLFNRLVRGRVDLTLYGHIHSYYRFNNAGIPAHVSGGGGAIPERFDALGRHFLDVRIDERGVSGVRVVRVD